MGRAVGAARWGPRGVTRGSVLERGLGLLFWRQIRIDSLRQMKPHAYLSHTYSESHV